MLVCGTSILCETVANSHREVARHALTHVDAQHVDGGGVKEIVMDVARERKVGAVRSVPEVVASAVGDRVWVQWEGDERRYSCVVLAAIGSVGPIPPSQESNTSWSIANESRQREMTVASCSQRTNNNLINNGSHQADRT